ncbi:hypothetical protein [Parabacteroides merdae]|uniref:hypothetical protein n=1 Tax=Parabacteroides merdae TaxID=46503 RepID=UPI0018656CCB|nr:hypothetical protein [Parabacteroides merdae]
MACHGRAAHPPADDLRASLLPRRGPRHRYGRGVRDALGRRPVAARADARKPYAGTGQPAGKTFPITAVSPGDLRRSSLIPARGEALIFYRGTL